MPRSVSRALRVFAALYLVAAACISFAASVVRNPVDLPAGDAGRPGNASIHGRVQNVVTGQYLNNARVTIRDTDLVAFTDEFGTYRLASVPAGRVVLEVFYTDLDAQSVELALSPGQSLERNIALTSLARYGRDAAVVTLDPYLVAVDRETDAQAIANNEQRFAPNLKNVMSTDSLGDVVGSSVGEFLKFIPGVTVSYDNASVRGVSIRGIDESLTNFSADGAPMVSLGQTANATRAFDTNSMALNDISRIEVTKVPTPSTRADSLSGSVNLVSKSAFERSRAQFRYGVSLVGNSENLKLRPTPRSYDDRKTRKITPGLDFDFTLPIGRNFGLVLTGLTTNRFNEQHISQMTYNTGGTSTNASLSQPFLQTHLLADDPRNEVRNTISLKADWRITRHSVLSVSSQWNQLTHFIGNDRLTSNAGNNGTPTPATGMRMSFGEDYTIGATGRGSITLAGTNQRNEQASNISKVRYRYDDGRWKIETSLSRSSSRMVRRNTVHGHFHQIEAAPASAVRVSLLEVKPDAPGAIEVYDANNRPIDLTDINNYRLTNATDVPLNKKGGLQSANLDVRRRLEFLPVPSSIQIGGAISKQTLDAESYTRTWTYNGPDGNPATPDSPAPYVMQTYVGQDPGYGFPSTLPWISPRRAWFAFEANPALFSQTPAQLVNQEALRVASSEFIQERVSAVYLQAEANLFRNRLKLLTGVRFEKTEDWGQGQLFDPNAVWVRNPDGTFARTPAGARIRKPEAGATNSMEELRLIRRERAYVGDRSYDGYYPSLHLTYDVNDHFLTRVAYAKTYGRPNFSDIIPNANINENNLTEEQLNDPSVIKGSITVRNTALRPWTADNYDVSLEYYTQQGGMFSGGVFLKEITDFFGTGVRIATAADVEELGLDPRYVGWSLNTKFNSGDARISGVEMNVRHSLRALGTFGSYFTVFANGTKLRLEGHQQAAFASFINESANWGASFSRKKISLVARWNYRGLDKNTALPSFGPDAFNYIAARTTLDLSFACQMSRRFSLTAAVNNVFNEPQVALRYGSETPAYARQFNTRDFGVIFSVGLRGTF